ncbi:hypothetical protein A3A76_01015 [Candidatus Woesebacteria bacterium RIFCSPLOWO2_01_FULL_39_23]|uniref:ECF transporter S component n=1 Tax=Candidatus Woesebacteria bacterium RIFCSPHIGHO2_01_FULL_40_22 TaxID=1802499 RepID=A0A1F7YHS6_9BACT|nr:MAG: hypothetical protein A2141_05660 [Candidatus Woesebacteria bacterium RBG_16_40_11]OGM26822.1 MAG: hypothetical protein A2628_04690 [Candidatus Woesebacteria bacterium RIFCSPHIGHO2_01_FULL_40_22]OGM38210.1 MAG: hypothetical protein A3E41_02375 [Candidatus Woesebacteria bacterium RIFCSPHIGHO2_12_FULL_38_9]OGM63119.1 MAG: hypothetical protein A3A76_01015 [Candidatus Woesebacteria bacterium RIFCSPLOWO2_01_FULL_39_23]
MLNYKFQIKRHNKPSRTSYYLLLSTLFLVAFLERTVWDLGPNVELVTTVMILASFYLGRKESFWLTFTIIATTDRLIGNSSIFLFTWSGFLLPAFLAGSVFKYLSTKYKHPATKKILDGVLLTSLGISSNIFFYLWTNFGVWLLDSWEMYTNNLRGLLLCYINGLPFLKNQMVSSLLFIPLGIVLIEAALKLAIKYKSNYANYLQILKDSH